MKAKLPFALFIFSFLSYQGMTCSCGDIYAIDKYPYIALVKLVDVVPSDLYKTNSDVNSPPPLSFHEIKIKTLAQFKGQPLNTVIIQGGNQKYNLGMTSCDLDMRIGDQWIIFGYEFKGTIATGYCTMTTQYTNADSETDYQSNRANQLIDRLRDAFFDEKIERPQGYYEERYANGILKLSECYDNGKLQEQRVAYYSNGQLMLEEHYDVGLKNGPLIWHKRDGKLRKSGTYMNNKQVGEHRYYDILGDLKYIRSFDSEGNLKENNDVQN